MRTFRRYQTDIPVTILEKNEVSKPGGHLSNVSYGGLACRSEKAFKSGELVSVTILQIDPPFKANGIVIWCDAAGDDGYELGIRFNEGREAFTARMVAQVCQIEEYKRHVLETEGRDLSGDEAALEWIEKNAHSQEMHERSFIRHPMDIPIEISSAQQSPSFDGKLGNFSLEGACFESITEIKPGEYVQIQLPCVINQSHKKVEGVVIWCCKKGEKYDVGVKFKDDGAFHIAMLKHIARLESFKEEIERREGRVLTGEETVAEFTACMAKSKLKSAG